MVRRALNFKGTSDFGVAADVPILRMIGSLIDQAAITIAKATYTKIADP